MPYFDNSQSHNEKSIVELEMMLCNELSCLLVARAFFYQFSICNAHMSRKKLKELKNLWILFIERVIFWSLQVIERKELSLLEIESINSLVCLTYCSRALFRQFYIKKFEWAHSIKKTETSVINLYDVSFALKSHKSRRCF